MSQPMHLVPPAPFPRTRLRRLRQHPWSRRLVAEHRLAPADLIQPLFVLDGQGQRQPCAAMPGIDRLSHRPAAAAGRARARARHTRFRAVPGDAAWIARARTPRTPGTTTT